MSSVAVAAFAKLAEAQIAADTAQHAPDVEALTAMQRLHLYAAGLIDARGNHLATTDRITEALQRYRNLR